MSRSIRIVPLLLLALALPASAVAKQTEIKGPAILAGTAFVGGELTMASLDEQRPFTFQGRAGYVGFLDLAGDLKVRCTGSGEAKSKETDKGRVYICMGRGGVAHVLGSHFRFRGFALRYRILVPEGASGEIHGRYVICGDGGDKAERACAAPADGERNADRGNRSTDRGERKADRGDRKDDAGKGDAGKGDSGQEKQPSLAELAAMLAAKK